jgi:acetyltransferase-like isoleucine patch superfamily enzyme
MKAYVVNTGTKVSPFGEEPHRAVWAHTTIGGAIDDALTRRGIARIDVGADEPINASEPTIVLSDACFVTDKALGDFLDLALDVKGDARLALAKTPAVDFVRPVSSVVTEAFDPDGPGAKKEVKGKFASTAENNAKERCAFDCFVTSRSFARASDALVEMCANATRVVVPKKELGIPLRMPVLGDAQQTQTVVPITSTVAAHVEHWTHILWLNQLAFGVRWNEIARQHKAWCIWRGLLGLPTVPRIMRSLVRKGKNVRIHPTAHVEASILGDNVVIGARASVRNSILGERVEVGDHATVLSSTLGARTFITPRTFVVWSATYEDAVLSNYKLQVSLVGRAAAMSNWAGLIDAKLQGAIDVLHDGKRQSTERSFLGSCIGHGAFVGAKVLVLPGREVPNDTFIAMRPDELIVDVPKDLPTGVPLVRDKGTLVPLDKLLG